MKNSFYTVLAILAVCLFGRSSAAAAPRTYESGFASISRISRDLYRALEATNRTRLLPVPILLEKHPLPYLEPSTYSDGTNSRQAVYLSAGLIDFLNCLAHAKALEDTEPGVYNRYIASLRHADSSLPSLPPGSNTNAWSFNTMNQQVSRFNQMAGTLVAIGMAHHYLGHYKKYEARLKDASGNPVPLHRLVTPEEWHDAMMKGAKNALDCGLGVEGLKLVLDALQNKEARPAWAIYLIPPEANLSKAKRDLTLMEKDFFLLD